MPAPSSRAALCSVPAHASARKVRPRSNRRRRTRLSDPRCDDRLRGKGLASIAAVGLSLCFRSTRPSSCESTTKAITTWRSRALLRRLTSITGSAVRREAAPSLSACLCSYLGKEVRSRVPQFREGRSLGAPSGSTQPVLLGAAVCLPWLGCRGAVVRGRRVGRWTADLSVRLKFRGCAADAFGTAP